MKLSSTLPQPLPQECNKAAKIFRSFVTPGHAGLDKVIPNSVLQNAKGFAILTVVKAGFVFSARAGSGLVIARLDDGSFSAPSAIGTAGMGFGGQLGAEMTEFLIILNTRSALKSFMSAGSVSLGGNMSVAVGPLGRSGEASGTLNTKGRVAAMFSYSKTKGLFGGVSLEGSVIVERQDANAIAYGSDLTAKQLLSGALAPPYWANPLIQTLQDCIGVQTPPWMREDDSYFRTARDREYSFAGIGNAGSGSSTPTKQKSGSLANTLLRRSGSVKTSRTGSPFSESNSYASPTSYTPEDDEHRPNKRVIPYDAFTDDDEQMWGVQVPLEARRGVSAPLVPSVAPSNFTKHFDSDFDASYGASGRNRPLMQSRAATAPVDPFPDLTTSMNAFSFSPEAPNSTSKLRKDGARSTSPFYHSPSPHAWADKPMYNAGARARSSTGTSVSYRSDSPPTPPSSVGGHVNTSSKPPKKLSLRAGLEEPAPVGSIKAVALFDYSAAEAGDLSFREGDVIWVTEKTETRNDWWTGVLASDRSRGIFPANFVILDD